MHLLPFFVFALASLLGSLCLALPYPLGDVNAIGSRTTKAARSADTCADPSLAHPVFQGFNPSQTAHNLNFFPVFENVNSVNHEVLWGDLHPAFNAWPTQQEFTFPLWQLTSPGDQEYLYVLGANAQTAPIINGFSSDVGVIGWAYSSQVCGSVPLMSALLSSTSDTFFTIDPFVHNSLIAQGWADNGVVAYVLPLNAS